MKIKMDEIPQKKKRKRVTLMRFKIKIIAEYSRKLYSMKKKKKRCRAFIYVYKVT